MKDLTNLKTYIIDSDNPKEIDDAISIEIDNNKNEYLWIHITNPCRLFDFDSKLDKDARIKCSSLYLLDEYIPMLPKELIQEANLKQHKISETISACIQFNIDGSINKYSITEARIKPNYELSYSDADQILELEPIEEYELIKIRDLIKKSLSYRKNKGAIIFDNINSKLSLKNDNLIFEKIENSTAHEIVSESMILMGYVTSEYLINNNVSAPFRSQKINCNAIEILEKYRESIVKYSILKQYMGKSYTSTKANIHETLGLKSYVQSTSPLRRYLDLLVLRQVFLLLNNNKVIKESIVSEIIDLVKQKQIEINTITKNNKQHFLRIFFKRGENITYKIIFIKWVNPRKNIALVYFSDLGLETLIILFITVETYPNKIYKIKYNRNSNSSLLEFIH